MKRVVIVGGGITGLAVAHALEKAAERCDVKLLEAAPALGGNLQTVRHNGFVIDAGPDSWSTAKPQASQLARDVGLGDELIGTRPDSRRLYIAWQRKLHVVPEDLLLGGFSDLKPLLDTELLGWDAKLRVGLDYVVPTKRWRDDDDESLGAFITRRLGSEVAERIASPIFGDLFTGDPDALSVRSCTPELVNAEREHGSLLVAMREHRERRRERASRGEAEVDAVVSLKRGVGDLVVNVAHKLRDAEVFAARPARKVDRLPSSDPRGAWVIETDGGPLYADDVALTVPAYIAAGLARELDPELAAMCGELGYTSTATIFLAYRKFDVRHPLDASGIVVPQAENRPILSCTFVSSKWDHRAPSGQVLLRVTVGGPRHEDLVAHDDADLVRIARSQVLDLLGIDRAPMFTKVFRFERASPQPRVGHLGRTRRLFQRAAMHDGLHLGGNGYVGLGIPDAVRQGHEIAARITPLV